MVSEQTPCKTTNSNVELVLCILFGWMGAHRFYTKKYKSAVLYLLTVGLCGIGWIVDIATIIKKWQNATLPVTARVLTAT